MQSLFDDSPLGRLLDSLASRELLFTDGFSNKNATSIWDKKMEDLLRVTTLATNITSWAHSIEKL